MNTALLHILAFMDMNPVPTVAMFAILCWAVVNVIKELRK